MVTLDDLNKFESKYNDGGYFAAIKKPESKKVEPEPPKKVEPKSSGLLSNISKETALPYVTPTPYTRTATPENVPSRAQVDTQGMDQFITTPEAQQTARNTAAYLGGTANEATFGLGGLITKQGTGIDYVGEAQQYNPELYELGQLTGSLLPFGIAGKAISKLIPALSKPTTVLGRGAKIGLEGLSVAPAGTFDALREGKSIPESIGAGLTRGLEYGAFGLGLGMLGKYASPLIGAGLGSMAYSGLSDDPNAGIKGAVLGGILGATPLGIGAASKRLANITSRIDSLPETFGATRDFNIEGKGAIDSIGRYNTSQRLMETMNPQQQLALPQGNMLAFPKRVPESEVIPLGSPMPQGIRPLGLELPAPEKRLGLPAPVYQQPPAKPIKLGEAPQGKFDIKPETVMVTKKGKGLSPTKLVPKTFERNVSDFTPQNKTVEPIRKYTEQIKQINAKPKEQTVTRETPFRAFPGEVTKANTPPKVQSEFAVEKFANPVKKTKTLKATKTESIPQRTESIVSTPKTTEGIKKTPSVKNEPLKTQNTTSSNKSEFGSDMTVVNKPKKQPIITSSRQLPEISKMTKEQFDSHYKLDQKPSKTAIENLIEDVGAKVINKVGSNDIPTIVKHYQSKYKLPENIKVSFGLTKATAKGNTTPIRDANGNVTGYRININPNQSIEGKVGSLRHEIEHIVDLQSGYAPQETRYKFNSKTDTTGRTLYENASKGHHKQYGWFEPDYLRRASIKDALKSGQKVPENILAEYPDLKSVKPIEAKIQEPTIEQPKIIETNKEIQNKRAEEDKGYKVFDLESGNTKERGFSRNVRTDGNMNDKIRDSYNQEPIKYNEISNQKTLTAAQNKFNKGFDKALTEFEATEKYKPEDIPLSRMLANEAAKRGDIALARRIIARVAEKLTEAGQLSQAAKILRKSDPSTFINFIERQVAKLNEKGQTLYGDKWKELKVSDARIKEIYKLEIYDETAMERMMNGVYDDLTQQLPVTKMEKFDAWRRMAMLLNPKTHIRNIVGNTFMAGLRKTSDTIGAALQKAFLKPGERTQSFGWSRNNNIVNKVNEDWIANKEYLTKQNRYDIEGLNVMNQDKRIFQTEALEYMNQLSKKTLEAEDVFFLERGYKDALGQYMKANQLNEVTEIAREYAARRAYEATFKQINALSTLITKAKQTKVVGKLVEAAIPFSKTPTNIAMRAFEYSPAGLAKALYSGAKKQGAAKVIEDLSKGLTGTALVLIGWQLASIGWARAAKYSSKNAEALKVAQGEQPYSITTPIGSYTFDWAQPTSVPLAMGMAFHDAMVKNTNPSKAIALEKAITKSIFAGADTLFGMTVLKSLTDAIGGKYGSVSEGLASLPANYLEQAYPTLMGQISKSIDTTKRSSYSDTGSGSFARQLAAKTPFLSKNLEPDLDVFGEEQKQNPAWMQFLSPGFAKGKIDDSMLNELNRLYETTKETDFLPKKANTYFTDDGKIIRLSPEELTEYQRSMGTYAKENIDKVIRSSAYESNRTTDNDRIKALQKVVEDSQDYAKDIILKNRGLLEDKPKTLKKTKNPINVKKITSTRR